MEDKETKEEKELEDFTEWLIIREDTIGEDNE